MGLLAQMAHNPKQVDLVFTTVKIVSLETGQETVINVVDPIYSIKGVVVKTITLGSFEGEWASLYMELVAYSIKLARECEMAIRAGRIY